jgi:uncharacterized protein (DUF2147 family)
MKRILLAISALAVAAAPASAFSKSLEGRWKNGAMEIVIGRCGQTVCGRVVKASEQQRAKAQRGSGTHLVGAKVIDNIQPSGPGKWNADVYVASRDMNARGTIQEVNPDRLMVRGCVLAIICKTTHWDRIG